MPKGREKEYALPSAARLFLRAVAGGIFSDNPTETPFTEKDFSKAELSALREAVANAREAGRSYILYEDYNTKETPFDRDLLDEIGAVFDDPARSALMSIGRARFNEDNILTDTYDFNGSAGAGGIARTLGRAVGLISEDDIEETFKRIKKFGPNVTAEQLRIRGGGRPVRINLGNIENPEVQALTQKVLAAAAGKPAPVSLSSVQDAQTEAERQLGLMVLQQFAGGQGQSKSSQGSQPAKGEGM